MMEYLLLSNEEKENKKMITFQLCSYMDIKEQVEAYYDGKDILVDSFWEDHVRESSYYQILESDRVIGFCSIYQRTLLTMFHIQDADTKYAQMAFQQGKYLEDVLEAFAPTGDEQLVSLCMDSFKGVENQAYFSRDLMKFTSTGIMVRLAVPEEAELIKEISGDFFGDIPKLINKGVIYMAYQGEEHVGFGAYEIGTIRKDYVSVGMFVRPEYRRKGVGRNLLGAMKEVVRSNGKKAISGCWYYNHNSLKTQFSCGNACNTRLLRFRF